MGKEIIKETTYPLITIAIPTYNRANLYLEQAIESAINQTYSNVEIVIVLWITPRHHFPFYRLFSGTSLLNGMRLIRSLLVKK